jgi:hypothetical protein
MTKTKRTISSLLSLRFLPYTLSPVPCFGNWNLELAA